MADSFSVQMKEILDDYSKDVVTAANSSIEKVSSEAVRKLRSSSPRKTGSYAKGWGTKKERGFGKVLTVIVHNRTDYQLTHLLERGHVIRNKKGVYGRAPAHPHITPVEEWANQELPEEIERELK